MFMFDVEQSALLLTAFCSCAVGPMPPKKDSASEPALPLPPGEDPKTAAEKDGNILDSFCSQN